MGACRVVVAARKGGAGKTVVAVLLARELVHQGARVLVLDLDAQRVGASLRLGVDVSSPLGYTAVDLVMGPTNGGRPFAPQTVVPGKLDVVAGNQADLASFEHHLGALYQEMRLMEARPRRAALDTRLEDIAAGYDFIVIDTPTGLGEITTNALEAATLVLSPIDLQSSDNIESVVDLCDHLREVVSAPPVLFLPNKAAKTKECAAGLARARELCGERLLEQLALPLSTAIPQSMSQKRELRGGGETGALVSERVWGLAQFVMRFGPAPLAEGDERAVDEVVATARKAAGTRVAEEIR